MTTSFLVIVYGVITLKIISIVTEIYSFLQKHTVNDERQEEKLGGSSKSKYSLQTEEYIIDCLRIKVCDGINNQSALLYRGAGSQCTSMAYMALMYCAYRSPAVRNTAILDAILKEGDEMFMNNPYTYQHFEYTELPRRVAIKLTFSDTFGFNILHLEMYSLER